MKDTFGIDSFRIYGRWVEGTGGSSLGDRNVLLSDSLSLGSALLALSLALSPDANSAVKSFTSLVLYSSGDDSETTRMLVLRFSSAFEMACYNTHNAINYVHIIIVTYISLHYFLKTASFQEMLYMKDTKAKIYQKCLET